jgi:hypothetical protein
MKNSGALALAGVLSAAILTAQLPPGQPASGPGGREYSHAAVVASVHGEGDLQYWIFEPAEPRPSSAPVVAFFHGWSAMTPGGYAGWIDHLVRRGSIVIYPRYQESLATPTDAFTKNALTALQLAFEELSRAGHVAPRLDRIAAVGHSVGGLLAANYAALAAPYGLPAPRAVMSVEPGKTWGFPDWTLVALEDLSAVPAETLLLSVAGDVDIVALDIDAKRIFHEATQVPVENKDFVLVRTDTYGSPDLNADHFAPASPGWLGPGTGRATRIVTRGSLRPIPETGGIGDALDFYGFWKLFDALMDAAFLGTNREYALGNTPQQRHMGFWSGGRPVRPLQITDQP